LNGFSLVLVVFLFGHYLNRIKRLRRELRVHARKLFPDDRVKRRVRIGDLFSSSTGIRSSTN
jgi:hypothetical protein